MIPVARAVARAQGRPEFLNQNLECSTQDGDYEDHGGSCRAGVEQMREFLPQCLLKVL